jgi:paraquat-inducible protein B
MNKKMSPAVIGAFVLGAVALIIIAILVFGSGRLFRQTRTFVLYFDNSVNGLRIGAPVKIKGSRSARSRTSGYSSKEHSNPRYP